MNERLSSTVSSPPTQPAVQLLDYFSTTPSNLPFYCTPPFELSIREDHLKIYLKPHPFEEEWDPNKNFQYAEIGAWIDQFQCYLESLGIQSLLTINNDESDHLVAIIQLESVDFSPIKSPVTATRRELLLTLPVQLTPTLYQEFKVKHSDSTIPVSFLWTEKAHNEIAELEIQSAMRQQRNSDYMQAFKAQKASPLINSLYTLWQQNPKWMRAQRPYCILSLTNPSKINRVKLGAKLNQINRRFASHNLTLFPLLFTSNHYLDRRKIKTLLKSSISPALIMGVTNFHSSETAIASVYPRIRHVS